MQKPWYKQFWPWFVIAIPATSVIYSLTAVYIFSQNQVDLVAENYYKEGKAINVDLSRLRVSDALKLKASVNVDENSIVLNFDKGDLATYPNLRVTFTHRTLANNDFTQMVSADLKGTYRFNAPEPLLGPWFVELEPFDGDWMLQGRVNLPTSDPISLYGQVKE
ncbi:FixH family protein [Photobacterium lipolyticum]|uniref:Nitrogen fixation protein FixH n=1 Tax=Photobacterium lipolyticum TaxID=266810 RepID=A0A2T3N1P6_9GAMM|nr:FixH family protein [Photobacterium lipolyticum]PSW06250.1 nitrogen fixation protein FixH [Photobacterium lipolyticum]